MDLRAFFPTLLSLCLCTVSSAQAPLRMGYSGNISAYHITECANGDLILHGNYGNLLRIHDDGTVVWAKTTPTTTYALAGVSETLTGDLLVALNVNQPDSPGYSIPALIRLSAEGDFIQGNYLHFPSPLIAATSFMRTTPGRHVLFLRDLAGLAALVCFDDASAIFWAISPSGDPDEHFTDMAPNPGGGVYLFDAGHSDGVAMSISALGQIQWSRYYGLGVLYGGTIAGAANLPGDQIAFIGRAAIDLENWGDFLVMRTDQNGLPIDVTGYDHGATDPLAGCSIASAINGDLLLSVEFGTSDELLMRTTSTGAPVWTKHNGGNLQQFGGDARVLANGLFAHLITVNEFPVLRYFRSDAALNVEGCYEDFAVTVLDPPEVETTELAYSFEPITVTFTEYTAPVSDVDVTEMTPCLADGIDPLADAPGPSVWPIPTSDLIHIDNLIPGSTVILRDMSGKTIRSLRVESAAMIVELAQLADGMYVLDMMVASGPTRVKILKQVG